MSNRYVGGVITETVNVAQSPWSGEWTEQAQMQGVAQSNWAPYSAQIGNSLRFRSSASAYLSRTPASAGNRQTWTWSGWVKAYGNQNGTLFAARTGVGASYTILSFAAANGGVIRFVDSTTTYPTVEWTRVFRDPSAWYHIVFVCDTTQAVAANRARLYVNGEAVTVTTSLNAPAQNAALTVNSTDTHLMGQQASGSYLDGYMADINFIDGQALTPSYFGMFDAVTGVWKPTVYTGSYGTNGFHLSFSNGTSTTTLGYDSRSGTQNVLITEGDGSAQTIYAGVGACAVSTISTANASIPSASNEYLIATLNNAVTVGASLKIYFDVNKTWANGRNLYINGSAVSTANVSTAVVSGMYEWTIDYTAAGITSISSLTTPQNSGGRAVFYGLSVDGNTIYTTANNWTCNNISLTSGSTYDWMLDSPTPQAGSSYGVGNYSVVNPLTNSSVTCADGNLSVSSSSGSWQTAISTIGMTSGKWYCEVTVIAIGTNDVLIGLTSNYQGMTYPGSTSTSYGYIRSNGNKYNNSSASAYGAAYTTNDVIGIAFDADAGTLVFYKNNTSQGTAFSSLTSGPYYFAFSGVGGSSLAVNFGQRPFAYTPPTGFKSLCTYNLPAASITNGANYFAATLYTGNGATQAVSNAVLNAAFQPDFVWAKQRSTASNHGLFDSVRGAGYDLRSNSTASENYDLGVSAFNTGGFTLGGVNWNDVGVPIVAWNWKAGGTAVTNTNGSITSSVSANTTSGFAVVTYSGNSTSGATIGHGLGVAPSMVIAKKRNDVDNWMVYHSGLTSASYFIKLNAASSQVSDNSIWNGTAPSASVFTVGNGAGTNTSGYTYVAYCFAAIPGFSAFGSYTGNGSSDGPFIYCGFRPRYVLVKLSSGTENWYCQDSSRGTYNANTYDLAPNLSNAEQNSVAYNTDFLSNGFKLRTSDTSINTSSGTFIYAAFAENPFQNALAR